MEVNSQVRASPLYLQGIAPGTHWIGGGMEPGGSLNTVEKRCISVPAGNRTWILRSSGYCIA
jgi:hypothetical protein